MKKILIVLRLIVAIALVLFLLISPKYLLKALEWDPYREFLTGEEETGFRGIIRIWHIVDFKTYQGSVSAFLENTAAAYEKNRNDVYIEIIGLSAEAAQERIARGEQPDVWSVSLGRTKDTPFMPLGIAQQPLVNGLPPLSKDKATLALPYLYSGYFLLANTILYQRLNLPFPGADEIASFREGKTEPIRVPLQSAMDSNSTTVHGALSAPEWLIGKLKLNGKNAPEGDFKAGQVPFMIGDARACGDLARKADDGGFTFDAVPLGLYTDQVQYIGMNQNIEKAKIEDARAFIALLLSEEMQQKITALGALPARTLSTAPTYADTLLQSFFEAYQKPLVEDMDALKN